MATNLNFNLLLLILILAYQSEGAHRRAALQHSRMNT